MVAIILTRSPRLLATVAGSTKFTLGFFRSSQEVYTLLLLFCESRAPHSSAALGKLVPLYGVAKNTFLFFSSIITYLLSR